VTDPITNSGTSTSASLGFSQTNFKPAVIQTTTGDVSPGTFAKIYTGDATPSSPATGDIWIDSEYGSGTSNILRWRDSSVTGLTSLSGIDDNGTTLAYVPGYEQVYINGVLQFRGSDYTATNGTSITGLTALVAGDVVEVIAPSATQFGDYYTQAQSDTKFNAGFRYSSATYLTSGSGTFTVPAGTRTLRIRMVGGGGGGAGSGGATGAGNGGNGGTGGSTTFGSSLLTATGGGGGGNSSNAPGTGGSGTVSSPAVGLVFPGVGGSVNWQYNAAANAFTSGVGGPPSPLGRYGAGGAGAGNNATPVCVGTSGGSAGYVEATIESPSATYSYSVGAAGTAGAAGTSGAAGTAGGSGAIIIEVYA
jgi:hypothetical protein